MCDDDPGWRVFFNMLCGLYQKHPVRIDIAGTIESIAEITDDLLYRCYRTFYNLHNMVLAVAGKCTVDEVLEVADRLLKPCEDQKLETVFPEETLDFIEQQNIKFDVVSMDTCRGILDGDTHMGIRENVELRERLRRMHAVTPDTEYYLNHYSHMCGMIPQEYERLVGQEGFLLTYDGLSVTV